MHCYSSMYATQISVALVEYYIVLDIGFLYIPRNLVLQNWILFG